MWTLAEIGLLVLRIAEGLISYANASQSIKAGTDAEIAKVSATILVKTNSAKAVMQEITSMTEAQVDQTLKGLEP